MSSILASSSQEDEESELYLLTRRQLRHHCRKSPEVQKMPFPVVPGRRNDGERHPDGGAKEDAFPEDDPEARTDVAHADRDQRGRKVSTKS